MQSRTKTLLLEVYLTIVCALGAGFSGDMLARTAGHASQHARHMRGNPHRGARSSGRVTQGEHAQEVELVRDFQSKESDANSVRDSANQILAILPTLPVVTEAGTDLGLAQVVQAGFVPAAERLQLPARAPPAVA